MVEPRQCEPELDDYSLQPVPSSRLTSGLRHRLLDEAVEHLVPGRVRAVAPADGVVAAAAAELILPIVPSYLVRIGRVVRIMRCLGRATPSRNRTTSSGLRMTGSVSPRFGIGRASTAQSRLSVT